MTEWKCPECGGQWLRNFVFRHAVNQCSLLEAEDATHLADHDRLTTRGIVTRASTPTELVLLRVFRPDLEASEEPETVVTRFAPGVHERIIADLNPDDMTEKE